jgi:hypothetical protein
MATWTDSQRRALARMTAPQRLRDEVEADVAHERGLTDAEKDVRLQQVVRAAFHVLQTRDDRDRVVQPERPAPDFQAIWQRLVRARRSA